MGTDNVSFTKKNFDDAFQERLDRKHRVIPSIVKVDMLDGFVLKDLKLKPERLCIIEFESGKDAAIALSIRIVHVIVTNNSGMKKLYLVRLSVPGHSLTMQSVFTVIWNHLGRLSEIEQELKEIGAIRLSSLKEPNLSSDSNLCNWYRTELTRAGAIVRSGGVCSMVKRKFLIASNRSNEQSLKDQVLRLHTEECLIVTTLQQYQANGIVFEFEVPYEI